LSNTTILLTARPFLRWSSAICIVVALAACGVLPTTKQPEAPEQRQLPTSENLDVYLDALNGLTSDDPAHQADVFYAVEREYTRSPTTSNSLRYALALIMPGHPSTNAAEGKKILETQLATPERMTPTERALAAVFLREATARLKLDSDNRRLLATLDERSRGQANSDRRVQAQADENARLRKALAEAQLKLEAIKNIERSTIERGPSPPGANRESTGETQSTPSGR
jgi:hypothetical protein